MSPVNRNGAQSRTHLAPHRPPSGPHGGAESGLQIGHLTCGHLKVVWIGRNIKQGGQQDVRFTR